MHVRLRVGRLLTVVSTLAALGVAVAHATTLISRNWIYHFSRVEVVSGSDAALETEVQTWAALPDCAVGGDAERVGVDCRGISFQAEAP